MAQGQQLPRFDEIALRLTAFAVRVFAEYGLYGPDAVIPGVGLSAEDFAWRVVGEYAEGRIKHHTSKGSLITLLGKALKNDIISALRKSSHEKEESRSDLAGEGTDNEGSPGLDQMADTSVPDPLLIRQAKRLLA